jgi:hypothetical protein
MATKKTKRGAVWHGDEVSSTPSEDAEAAAERAEGNAPVEAEHLRDPDATADGAPDSKIRAPSGEAPDEKIAEAAEEHREDLDSRGRSPRGSL